MKRTYIKPEMDFLVINETTNLLQDSIHSEIDPTEEEEGRFQSKRHDFWNMDYSDDNAHNTRSNWDE